MNFSNKVVVITGADSGIAVATASLLSEYGAQLILVCKNAEEIQNVSDELVKFHGKHPLLLTADISKEEDVKKIEMEIIYHYGTVDVLINIEGGMQPDSILKPNLQAFDSNINLNLRSVYIMTTTFAKHLIRSKGNIVNVGSVLADVMFSGQVSYDTAKAGIDYLTKISALELAQKGVRVNCVKPGFMETNVAPKLQKCENKKTWEGVKARIPLGKLIDGIEIAQAIVYLASAQAKNITGTSIVLDGGLGLAGTTINKVRKAFD